MSTNQISMSHVSQKSLAGVLTSWWIVRGNEKRKENERIQIQMDKIIYPWIVHFQLENNVAFCKYLYSIWWNNDTKTYTETPEYVDMLRQRQRNTGFS